MNFEATNRTAAALLWRLVRHRRRRRCGSQPQGGARLEKGLNQKDATQRLR
jgi:hypothetical protein